MAEMGRSNAPVLGRVKESDSAVGVVRLLPEVFEDEYGERWWASGHVDPFAFVLSVVAELLDAGVHPDDMPKIHDMLEGVRHEWWRPTLADDDLMEVVPADARQAEAFTSMGPVVER